MPHRTHTDMHLTFALHADHAAVTGCSTDMAELIVPAEHRGLPVTEIAPGAFRGRPHLLSVTLPDSLRLVGAEAFADCRALMQVRAGTGLERLGERAFFRCISLRHLDFPGLPDADITAFAGCYQLHAAEEKALYRRTPD